MPKAQNLKIIIVVLAPQNINLSNCNKAFPVIEKKGGGVLLLLLKVMVLLGL